MVKSSMNPLIADYWTPEAILGPLAYFQPSALLQLDGMIPFVQNIQYGASIMLEPGAEANIESEYLPLLTSPSRMAYWN